MALWGGRFEGESDALFRILNDSLPIDWRLVREDITGSMAWAKALGQAGVLRDDEVAQLHEALHALLAEVEQDPSIVKNATDEDVHSFVEARLVERLGTLGKKLHTGRSRNDQVATDFRLWLRDELEQREQELHRAQHSLVNLAGRTAAIMLPGYTHLQRAQPILFAHWCLAYVEMLDRDAGRVRDARSRLNESPLGSAALAGSSFPVDRTALASALGFTQPMRNSLDAVSDRDFALEALAAASISALHLSRLAEDLICYASQEFGFVELDDSVSSGSSIMPQKKNPDALELLRGKTGRILGDFHMLAVTVKGLTLAYNKDLQEDKRPVFDAMDEWSLCLRLLPRVLDTLQVNAERCREAAEGGYANATELANYLVEKGMPFREAHEVTGRTVRHALNEKKALGELSLEELRAQSSLIEADVYDRLRLEAVIERCNVIGGTAPGRVREAIKAAATRLGSDLLVEPS